MEELILQYWWGYMTFVWGFVALIAAMVSLVAFMGAFGFGCEKFWHWVTT